MRRSEPAAKGERPGDPAPLPVLGLVGGIASGKSTVAAAFADLGAAVVDADALAHEALGTDEVRRRIVERFGPEVRDSDGSIDRKALAERVFGSRSEMADLEAIVHPPVLTAIRERLARARAAPEFGLAVLDAPLLLETGLDRMCDRIAFVEASEESRLERVKQSRGWDLAELRRREKLQKALKEKKRRADFTIDTESPERSLQAQTRCVWDEIARPTVRHAPSRSPHSSSFAGNRPPEPAEGCE